jgi:hypothetical protein
MIFCEMKTIYCALRRKRAPGSRKSQVELVGFTRETGRKKTSEAPKTFSFEFDYDEPEALVIGESLDERERKG